MGQYNTFHVICIIHKLISGIKNCNKVTLNLSSNMMVILMMPLIFCISY